MFACSRVAGWSAHILEQKRPGACSGRRPATSARRRARSSRRDARRGGCPRGRPRAGRGRARGRGAPGPMGRGDRGRGARRRLPRARPGLPRDRAVPLPAEARAALAAGSRTTAPPRAARPHRPRSPLSRPPGRRQLVPPSCTSSPRATRTSPCAGSRSSASGTAVRAPTRSSCSRGSRSRRTRTRSPQVGARRPGCAEEEGDGEVNPLVAVVMGSRSDWEVMEHCVETLKSLDVPHEVRVLSAHRTPDALESFVTDVEARGAQVFVAAAVAQPTSPEWSRRRRRPAPPMEVQLGGLDSLLSTVQMPAGIPVATLAIGRAGAVNAASSRPPSSRARTRRSKRGSAAIARSRRTRCSSPATRAPRTRRSPPAGRGRSGRPSPGRRP